MKLYDIKLKKIVSAEILSSKDKGIIIPASLSDDELIEVGYKRVVYTYVNKENISNYCKVSLNCVEGLKTYNIEENIIIKPLEEVKEIFLSETDRILNNKALEYGFDSINTAVSYTSKENEFYNKSISFFNWRVNVYSWANKLFLDVVNGKINLTLDNIEKEFKLMPKLEI